MYLWTKDQIFCKNANVQEYVQENLNVEKVYWKSNMNMHMPERAINHGQKPNYQNTNLVYLN